MNQKPELNELEKLNQLSKKELVKMILTQPEIIEQLSKEIEKLKISRSLDSKISSKPLSSDLLKKPERKKSPSRKNRKKVQGQLGHQGKTRKGFGRVDRFQSRSVMDFFTQALMASAGFIDRPSLIP